jgi:hypothetical protein
MCCMHATSCCFVVVHMRLRWSDEACKSPQTPSVDDCSPHLCIPKPPPRLIGG